MAADQTRQIACLYTNRLSELADSCVTVAECWTVCTQRQQQHHTTWDSVTTPNINQQNTTRFTIQHRKINQITHPAAAHKLKLHDARDSWTFSSWNLLWSHSSVILSPCSRGTVNLERLLDPVWLDRPLPARVNTEENKCDLIYFKFTGNKCL